MVIARSEQTTFFILHPLAQLEEFSVAGGKPTWLIDFGIIQAAGIARLKAEAPDLFLFIDHGCGAVHHIKAESSIFRLMNRWGGDNGWGLSVT